MNKSNLQNTMTTTQSIRAINHQKVSDNLDLMVTGENRTTGLSVTRSIRELLEQAAEGQYSENNLPCDENMLVKELLDWHADFNWQIQITDSETPTSPDEVKHTQGTWTISERNPRKIVCNSLDGLDPLTGENVIGGASVHPQAEANAKLMCAAPDLLAALEMAEELICLIPAKKLTNDTARTAIHTLTAVRKAIAKAKKGSR